MDINGTKRPGARRADLKGEVPVQRIALGDGTSIWYTLHNALGPRVERHSEDGRLQNILFYRALEPGNPEGKSVWVALGLDVDVEWEVVLEWIGSLDAVRDREGLLHLILQYYL